MTATTPAELTQHEDHIADALVGVIDYASRVLISADYGSHYQLDKLRGLREKTDRLVGLLEKQPLDWQRSEAVKAAVAREAARYQLGQILLDADRLGGTA